MKDRNSNKISETLYGIDPLYLKLHPTLRYNEDFFEKIVKKYPWLVIYAARKLRNDKFFLERMARTNGMVLKYLQKHYILTTVSANNFRGWEFRKYYVVDEPGIVIDAVKENGLALAYASEKKRNNETTVLAAIKQNWRAFQFCSKKIKRNNKVINFALLNAYSSKEFLTEGFDNENNISNYKIPEQFFTDEQLINFFTDEEQMLQLKKELKKTAFSILQTLDAKKPEDKKYAIKIFELTESSIQEIQELQEKYINLSDYKKDNIIIRIKEQIQEL